MTLILLAYLLLRQCSQTDNDRWLSLPIVGLLAFAAPAGALAVGHLHGEEGGTGRREAGVLLHIPLQRSFHSSTRSPIPPPPFVAGLKREGCFGAEKKNTRYLFLALAE